MRTSLIQRRIGVVAALCSLALTGKASANEMQPDDFVALPVGTHIFLNYASWSHSDRLNGADQVKTPADVSTFVNVPRYAYFFKVGPFVADINLLVPIIHVDDVRVGSSRLRGVSGVGDPQLVSTVWVVNDPKRREYLGVVGYLSVPLGQYDPKRPLNAGSNRWTESVQLGYWKGLTHKVSVEVVGDVTWYGNNHNADASQADLQQATTTSGQVWLRYDLDPKTYLAGGYYAATGGDQRLNGVLTGVATRYQKVRFAAARSLPHGMQIYGEISTDVARTDGFRQDFGALLRLAKAF